MSEISKMNSNKVSPFIVDVIVNVLLAIFVAFQISLPWAMTYLLIYLVITLKTLELTNIDGSEGGNFFIATMKDIFSLGNCLVSNLVIETATSAYSKLFYNKGERAAEDAEDFKNLGEALKDSDLLNISEQPTKASEHAANVGKSLQEYNDVFFGLNSVELTLGIYILVKALLIILIIRKKARSEE